MSTNLKRKLKPTRIVAIAGLIIALLFAGIVIYLAKDASDQVDDAVINKMELALAGQVHSIDLVVDSHYATLKAVSNHLEREGGINNIEHLTGWMNDIVSSGDFYRISVTDCRSDKVYYADVIGTGTTTIPSYDTYYYGKIKNSVVWNINGPFFVEERGVATIIITVPVLEKGQVAAVVAGMIELNDFVELTMAQGKDTGHSVYLLDRTGHIIVGVNHNGSLQIGGELAEGDEDHQNFLIRLQHHVEVIKGNSLQDFAKALNTDESGSMIFEVDDYRDYDKGYMVYQSLGYKGWNMIYLKDDKAVIEEFSMIQRESQMAIFAVVALCAVIIITIGLIYGYVYRVLRKSNNELKQSSAKYRILEEFTKMESFEFDVDTMTYRFGTKVQNRFGMAEYTSSADIIHAVHPEDIERYRQFENAVIQGGPLEDLEFRAKQISDGKYYWLKIHALELPVEKAGSRYIIGYLFDITQDQERLKVAIEKSERDFLTGLHTRESMINIITGTLEEDSEGCHALIILDLDKFKEINDSLGHDAGDRALTDCADCMKEFFRKEDFIGRFGGDEFFVFLPGIKSVEGVISRTQKFAEIVEKKTCEKQWDIRGCSIGMSIYPHDGGTYEKLYREADVAMYRSKKKDGICNVTHFSEIE